VLFDDRDAGPGEKFTDAELLGIPLRLTLGQALPGVRDARGPAPPRAARTSTAACPLAGAAGAVEALWRLLP
jgi:prolyl-tRNA synthetase